MGGGGGQMSPPRSAFLAPFSVRVIQPSSENLFETALRFAYRANRGLRSPASGCSVVARYSSRQSTKNAAAVSVFHLPASVACCLARSLNLATSSGLRFAALLMVCIGRGLRGRALLRDCFRFPFHLSWVCKEKNSARGSGGGVGEGGWHGNGALSFMD